MKKKLALILSIVLVLAAAICVFAFSASADELPYAENTANTLWESTEVTKATSVTISNAAGASDTIDLTQAAENVTLAVGGTYTVGADNKLTLTGVGLTETVTVAPNGGLWLEVNNGGKDAYIAVAGSIDNGSDTALGQGRMPLIVTSSDGSVLRNRLQNRRGDIVVFGNIGMNVNLGNSYHNVVVRGDDSANNGYEIVFGADKDVYLQGAQGAIVENRSGSIVFSGSGTVTLKNTASSTGYGGTGINTNATTKVNSSVQVIEDASLNIETAQGHAMYLGHTVEGGNNAILFNTTGTVTVNAAFTSRNEWVSAIRAAYGSVTAEKGTVLVNATVSAWDPAENTPWGYEPAGIGVYNTANSPEAGFFVKGTAEVVVNAVDATTATVTGISAPKLYGVRVYKGLMDITGSGKLSVRTATSLGIVTYPVGITTAGAMHVADSAKVYLEQAGTTGGNAINIGDTNDAAMVEIWKGKAGLFVDGGQLEVVSNSSYAIVTCNNGHFESYTHFTGGVILVRAAGNNIFGKDVVYDNGYATIQEGSYAFLGPIDGNGNSTVRRGDICANGWAYFGTDANYTYYNGISENASQMTAWSSIASLNGVITKHDVSANTYTTTVPAAKRYTINGGDVVSLSKGNVIFSYQPITIAMSSATADDYTVGSVQFTDTDGVTRVIVDDPADDVATVYNAASGSVSYDAKTKNVTLNNVTGSQLRTAISGNMTLTVVGNNTINGKVEIGRSDDNVLTVTGTAADSLTVNPTVQCGFCTYRDTVLAGAFTLTVNSTATDAFHVSGAAHDLTVQDAVVLNVSTTHSAGYAIRAAGDFIVTGGTVNATARVRAIYSWTEDSDVRISQAEGCTTVVNATTTGDNAIFVEGANAVVEISGGTVNATAGSKTSSSYAIRATDSVTISGGDVHAVSGWSSIYADKVGVIISGDLWDDTAKTGTRVIAEGTANQIYGRGTTGVSISGGTVVSTSSGEGALRASKASVAGGEITLTAPKVAFWSNTDDQNNGGDRSLTVTGGKIVATATSADNAIYFGSISISGDEYDPDAKTGTYVSATAATSNAISATTLTVSGGTVNATSVTDTAINATNLNIQGGETTATSSVTGGNYAAAVTTSAYNQTAGTLNIVLDKINAGDSTYTTVGLEFVNGTAANFDGGTLNINVTNSVKTYRVYAIWSRTVDLTFNGTDVNIDITNANGNNDYDCGIKVQGEKDIYVKGGSIDVRGTSVSRVFRLDDPGTCLSITGGEVTGIVGYFTSNVNSAADYATKPNNVTITEDAKIDVYYMGNSVPNRPADNARPVNSDGVAADIWMENAGWTDYNHWLTTDNWDSKDVKVVLTLADQTKVQMDLDVANRTYPAGSENPLFALSADNELLILDSTMIEAGQILQVHSKGNLKLNIPKDVTVNLGNASTAQVLNANGKLTVTGEGTLNITSAAAGIYTFGDVTISDVTVNIKAADNGIQVKQGDAVIENAIVNITVDTYEGIRVEDGDLKITGSTVNATAMREGGLHTDSGDYIQTNSDVTVTLHGLNANGSVYNNGSMNGGTLLANAGSITVTGGSLTVNSWNCNTAKFNPVHAAGDIAFTNTTVIVDAPLEKGNVVVAPGTFTIDNSYVKVNSVGNSVLRGDTAMVISGNVWDDTAKTGTYIEATGADNIICGYGEGLTINGGTVKATATATNALRGSNITINGGDITAIAANGGIYTNSAPAKISINGGKVVATVTGERALDTIADVEIKNAAVVELTAGDDQAAAIDGALTIGGTAQVTAVANNNNQANEGNANTLNVAGKVTITENANVTVKAPYRNRALVAGNGLEVSGNAVVNASVNVTQNWGAYAAIHVTNGMTVKDNAVIDAKAGSENTIHVYSGDYVQTGGTVTAAISHTSTGASNGKAILVENGAFNLEGGAVTLTTSSSKFGALMAKDANVSGGTLNITATLGGSGSTGYIDTAYAAGIVINPADAANGLKISGDAEVIVKTTNSGSVGSAVIINGGVLNVSGDAKFAVYAHGTYAAYAAVRNGSAAISFYPGTMNVSDNANVYVYSEASRGIRFITKAGMDDSWKTEMGVRVSGGQLEVYSSGGGIPMGIEQGVGEAEAKSVGQSTYVKYTGGVVLLHSDTSNYMYDSAFSTAPTGYAFVGGIGRSNRGNESSPWDRSGYSTEWAYWGLNESYQFYDPLNVNKGVLTTKVSDTEWTIQSPVITNTTDDINQGKLSFTTVAGAEVEYVLDMYSSLAYRTESNPVLTLVDGQEYSGVLQIVDSGDVVNFLDGVHYTSWNNGMITYDANGDATFNNVSGAKRVHSAGGDLNVKVNGTNVISGNYSNAIWALNGSLSLTGSSRSDSLTVDTTGGYAVGSQTGTFRTTDLTLTINAASNGIHIASNANSTNPDENSAFINNTALTITTTGYGAIRLRGAQSALNLSNSDVVLNVTDVPAAQNANGIEATGVLNVSNTNLTIDVSGDRGIITDLGVCIYGNSVVDVEANRVGIYTRGDGILITDNAVVTSRTAKNTAATGSIYDAINANYVNILASTQSNEGFPKVTAWASSENAIWASTDFNMTGGTLEAGIWSEVSCNGKGIGTNGNITISGGSVTLSEVGTNNNTHGTMDAKNGDITITGKDTVVNISNLAAQRSMYAQNITIVDATVNVLGQYNTVNAVQNLVIMGDATVDFRTQEFRPSDNARATVYNAVSGKNVLISSEQATKEGYPVVNIWASSSYAVNISGTYTQIGGTVDAVCYGHTGIYAGDGIDVSGDAVLYAESETNNYALKTDEDITISGNANVTAKAKSGPAVLTGNYYQNGGKFTVDASGGGMVLNHTTGKVIFQMSDGELDVVAGGDGIQLNATYYSFADNADGGDNTVGDGVRTVVTDSATFLMNGGEVKVDATSCAIRLQSQWDPSKEDKADTGITSGPYCAGTLAFTQNAGKIDLNAGGQTLYVNAASADAKVDILGGELNAVNRAKYSAIQVNGKVGNSYVIIDGGKVNAIHTNPENNRSAFFVNSKLPVLIDGDAVVTVVATDAKNDTSLGDYRGAFRAPNLTIDGDAKVYTTCEKQGMALWTSDNLVVQGNATLVARAAGDNAIQGGKITFTGNAKIFANVDETSSYAIDNKTGLITDVNLVNPTTEGGRYTIQTNSEFVINGNAKVIAHGVQVLHQNAANGTLKIQDNAEVVLVARGQYGIRMQKGALLIEGNAKVYASATTDAIYTQGQDGAICDITIQDNAKIKTVTTSGYGIRTAGALNILGTDDMMIDIDVTDFDTAWNGAIFAPELNMTGGTVDIDIDCAPFDNSKKTERRIITGIAIQGNDYLYSRGGNFTGGKVIMNIENNYSDATYTYGEDTNQTSSNRTFAIFTKSVDELNIVGTDFDVTVETALKNGNGAFIHTQNNATSIKLGGGSLIDFDATGHINALLVTDGNGSQIVIDDATVYGSANYFWNTGGMNKVLTITPKATIDFFCYSGDSRVLGTYNSYNQTYYNWYVDDGVEYLRGCSLDDNSQFVTTANAVVDGAASQVEIKVKEGSKTNTYVLNVENRFYGGNTPETAKAYYTPYGLVALNDLAAQSVVANGNMKLELNGTSTLVKNGGNVLQTFGDLAIGGEGVLEMSGTDYVLYILGNEIEIGEKADVKIISTKGNAIHINTSNQSTNRDETGSLTLKDDARLVVEATEAYSVGEDGKVSYSDNGRGIYLRATDTSVNVLGNSVLDITSTDQGIYVLSNVAMEGKITKATINIGENAKVSIDSATAFQTNGNVSAININGNAVVDLDTDRATTINGADTSLNIGGNAKVNIAKTSGDSINITSNVVAPEGVKQSAAMNVSGNATVVVEEAGSCGARIQITAKDEDDATVPGSASFVVTGEANVDITANGQTVYLHSLGKDTGSATAKIADKANVNLTNVSATSQYGSALTIYSYDNNVEFTTTGEINIVGKSAGWTGALFANSPSDGKTNVLIKDAKVNVTNIQSTSFETLNAEKKNTFGGDLSNAVNIAGNGEFLICGDAVVNAYAERSGEKYANRAHGLFLHPGMSLKIADSAEASFSAGGDSKANTGAGIHLKESDITVTDNATLRASATGNAVAGITFEGESGLTVNKYGAAFIDGGKDAAGIRGYNKNADVVIEAKDGARVLFTGAPAMNLKTGSFEVSTSEVIAGKDKESSKETAFTVVQREYEDYGYVLLKGHMRNPNTSDYVITSVVIAAIVAAAAAVAVVVIRKKKSQD